MRGLKLGVLVFSGLLVFGCSSKDTMSKEDKILSEKMKVAMFGTKEEFLADMKQRVKNLEKGHSEYNTKQSRKYQMKKNLLNKTSEYSVIDELGNPIKKENRMIKAFEHLPNLTNQQQAKITGLRAGLLFKEGQYIKAIPLFKQLIAYYKKNPTRDRESWQSYSGLHMSYMKLGLSKEAFNTSKEFILISQKNNANKEQLSQAFTLHGISYLMLKNYIKAIDFFKQSLNYITENRELSRRYKHIADAYLKLGQREKASYYLNKSLEVR